MADPTRAAGRVIFNNAAETIVFNDPVKPIAIQFYGAANGNKLVLQDENDVTIWEVTAGDNEILEPYIYLGKDHAMKVTEITASTMAGGKCVVYLNK